MVLPINKRLLALLVADAFSICFSIVIAYYVFFGSLAALKVFWWRIPLSLAIRLTIFWLFSVYRWSSRYVSVRELLLLLEAVVIGSLVNVAILYLLVGSEFHYSVLVVSSLLCFMFVGGTRLLIRLWREPMVRANGLEKYKNVLIVGAGDAGAMICREMLKSKNLGYKPVGFVDDNEKRTGEQIHSLPIMGTSEKIPAIVEEKKIAEIIIAIPSASGKQIRRIIDFCVKSGAKYRIIPGVYELIGGSVHISQIRNVQIEDLLGREPVAVDLNEIASYLSGSRVLVTGGGGSIGSELCRQIALFQPEELIVLGRGENSLFNIEYELRQQFPYLNLKVVVGDVRDANKVDWLFRQLKPTVVFHAAAHKHVSLMEKNPDEAVLNNIIGTKNLVEAADQYQVRQFVNISTDKAVRPQSFMGVSKRVAELIVQAKALSGSPTVFVSVRFGNVLGSRGSVLPLFKKQIAEGGPVTITHPEVKRYFMTVAEAAQLVIQAGAMGKGGEIFILDMGEPIKILDLAQDLIRLSGLEVGEDIEIKVIGLKPGEKLFEELLTSAEGNTATKHKKIFVAAPGEINRQELLVKVDELEELARKNDLEGLKRKFTEIVPRYGSVAGAAPLSNG